MGDILQKMISDQNKRSSSHETVERILIYWPFSYFSEVHVIKEAGGIAYAFTKLGKEVELVIGKLKCAPLEGIKVFETGNLSFYSWKDCVRELVEVPKILLKGNYSTIIVFNSGPLNPLIFLLYKLFSLHKKPEHIHNKPKLILKLDSDGTLRGYSNIKLIAYKIMLKLSSHLFDVLTIESSEAIANIIKNIKINKVKIKYVPNGYSSDYFPQANYSDFKRNDVVISVSRVSREKGLEILVNAFALVSDEFPSWTLLIAGQFDDWSYFKEITNLVEKFHLENRIFLLGNLDKQRVRELYLNSSIFAQVSLRESFGIARLEAMASGLPVISSESGNGNQLREYGAIVLRCGDIESTANSLRSLMSSEKLRKSIADKQSHNLRSWDDISLEFLRT